MNKYKPEGSLINERENQKYISDLEGLKYAYANRIILEAKADMCTSSHDLIVNLSGAKGFMPREEACLGIAQGKTKDIAVISRVGRAVCFMVTGFKKSNGEDIAILSRQEAQKECIDNYLSGLVCGSVIDARVTHIEQFGCFVDIGCGIPSMIPIDEISISRISSPSDRFYIGEDIKVAYKGYNGDKFFITHKELLGTWLDNAGMFSAGETVEGIVRSVESYGIFVELAPNLAGLAEPNEKVKVGQTASVYIKSINPEKMKIKLIIVDSYDSAKKMENFYFIDSGVISSWRYSPDNCSKIIETVF